MNMAAGAGHAAQGLSAALLRATPSAAVALDTDGRVTMLNAAAERLLGLEAPEAAGRLYSEVFGASLAHRVMALVVRALRAGGTGTAHTFEATLPGGRRATLRANAGPLYDAGGTLIGVFFVAEEQVSSADAADSPTARHLRQALQRYAGTAIATQVAAHPSFLQVGGVRQLVSVLHADVRGYTTLAEALQPEEVSELLLRYHGAAVTALGAVEGTIDRYVGDAILALWNAPAAQPEHARLAIRGALALRRATREVGNALEYGIGLHTGDAVVGNLGSAEYLHYTAIGDTVNVAARLQAAAPAGGIVCSAATLAAARDETGVAARPLGLLTVKGRRNPVEAYALEGDDG
jgi:PAS domain S-box-containing protein